MSERPKIKIPLEPVDIIIESITVILILLMIVFSYTEFGNLPETIPTHFNAEGIADGFSSKNSIWGLPIVGIVMSIGLFTINRFPHIHNYMVNITEENAFKNYRFSTRIVRGVNFFTIMLFAYIQYTIITSAKGDGATIGSWFLPVILSASILLPVFIIMYQKKLNKT